ncbi:hypothetical protein [Vibrio harveyi]|uniref:hypothetical protein n=1 Tax=Vibrio harveyi TaxID=669 RepID=UPI00067FFC17|nr:hypothetical protein [Vibrio harveyi]PNM43654.1 hypothetical protein AL469_027785 [Vibrio harveyi]
MIEQVVDELNGLTQLIKLNSEQIEATQAALEISDDELLKSRMEKLTNTQAQLASDLLSVQKLQEVLNELR